MTLAAVGFAFDAGSGGKSLTLAFAFCYAVGCVIAVLAVRQSGVFTAVIQPPLVLFFTVPAAYFVLTGGHVKGVKDIIINCGYPLIERFPLMFFTTGTVLLIGMVRWFFSASSRRARTHDDDISEAPEAAIDGRLAAASTSLMSATEAPRRSRRNSTARPARAAAAEDEEPRRKPAKTASSASRSRHGRPPDTELVEPTEHRPRRPRSTPPVDEPIEPRRRTRATPPHESRRTPPADRGTPYERPGRSERPERSGRPERSERAERPERSDRPVRGDRPERRRRPSDPDPFDGRSPGASTGRNGSSGTHHPVSRVRYRAEDAEPQSEERSHPRRPRDLDADSRDYGR
jgi:hypothetical protein